MVAQGSLRVLAAAGGHDVLANGTGCGLWLVPQPLRKFSLEDSLRHRPEPLAGSFSVVVGHRPHSTIGRRPRAASGWRGLWLVLTCCILAFGSFSEL